MLESEEVQRRRGTGARSDDRTRATFGGRLSGDLSEVMVHRGPLAGQVVRGPVPGYVVRHPGVAVVRSPGVVEPVGGGSVQRATAEHTPAEADGRVVERALADEVFSGQPEMTPRPALTALDLDALVERVYRRLWDQLRLERERAAWIP